MMPTLVMTLYIGGIKMNLREKLKEHIIDKKASKWNVKMLNVDDEETEIPHSLEGEILVDIVTDESGRVLMWGTISVEDMEKALNRRDKPNLRRDEVLDHPKFHGRNLRSLSALEYEELTGKKKWFDKWRAGGIKI